MLLDKCTRPNSIRRDDLRLLNKGGMRKQPRRSTQGSLFDSNQTKGVVQEPQKNPGRGINVVLISASNVLST